MSRNKPGSPHYSTPQSGRTRPKVGLTLSREAVEKLDALALETGLAKSTIIETLIKQADLNFFRDNQK